MKFEEAKNKINWDKYDNGKENCILGFSAVFIMLFVHQNFR